MNTDAKNIRHNIKFAKLKIKIVKLKDNNKKNKQLTKNFFSKKIVNIFSFIIN